MVFNQTVWLSVVFSQTVCVSEANTAADVLFHDVLGRKDRADATRNALSVLSRFKFLFNLPCSMERNIKTVCIMSFNHVNLLCSFTALFTIALVAQNNYVWYR